MSRFSDWYLNARARIAQQERVQTALTRQQEHEQHMRKKRKQRKEQYKEIDKTMREMRRPDDTPPWEKK